MDETLSNQPPLNPEILSFRSVNLKPGMALGESGNYKLEKLLGEGGMGQVWLATEIEGGVEIRRVVCKIIPAFIQKDPDEIQKIFQTFQRVQGLNHPNICPIYSLESDPVYGFFFVMGYAEGGTLWNWFQAQPNHESGLPLERVFQTLQPIAAALDYAHSLGVIHRDVKPQNILFTVLAGQKIPWLVDFEISAQLHETWMLTRSPFPSAGSPACMAPEQWNDEKQDARTDQYALAVMAYVFLTGRLPFRGNVYSLPFQVMTKPVPDGENLSRVVNQALKKGLAKNREERFVSCVEFLNALMASEPVSVLPEVPAPDSVTSPKETRVSNLNEREQDEAEPGVYSWQKRQYLKELQRRFWPNESLEQIARKTVLDLRGMGINTHDLTAIGFLTELKSLDLSYNPDVTDWGLEELKHLTKLEILKLTKCHQITDAGMVYLLGMKNLKELYLPLQFSPIYRLLTTLTDSYAFTRFNQLTKRLPGCKIHCS